MANITLPSNPVNGQTVVIGTRLFKYDSTANRWKSRVFQVLGDTSVTVTNEAPTITASLSEIALDTSGANVSFTYTVSDVDSSVLKVSHSVSGIANSDLATVTHHKANNTVTITTGTQAFTGGQITLTVTDGRNNATDTVDVSSEVPWSLDVTSFTLDVSKEVNGLNHTGMLFSDNGNYIHFLANDSYKRFYLPTAYDVTVMQSEFSSVMNSESAGETDWVSNGTYFLIAGGVGNDEYLYAFTVNQSNSPLDYGAGRSRDRQLVVRTDGFNSNLTISNDGLQLFFSRRNKLYQFTLSSPYRTQTLDFINDPVHTVTMPQGNGTYTAAQFNENGTELYWMYYDSYWRIKKYTLSTPFDISTLSATSEESGNGDLGSTGQGDRYNFKLSPDGTKAYFLQNNGIAQYSTGL